MQNENGYCKKCNLDLDGADIVQTFIRQGKSPDHAQAIAEGYYGYRAGHTKWSNAIAIYDSNQNTIHHKCPVCDHTWERT